MKGYPQILLTILRAATAVAVVVAAVFVGAYYYVAPTLPQAAELRDLKMQVPLQVYSRDGRLIAEFGEMKRTPVDYEDIPPLLIEAVIATEDEHPGAIGLGVNGHDAFARVERGRIDSWLREARCGEKT